MPEQDGFIDFRAVKAAVHVLPSASNTSACRSNRTSLFVLRERAGRHKNLRPGGHSRLHFDPVDQRMRCVSMQRVSDRDRTWDASRSTLSGSGEAGLMQSVASLNKQPQVPRSATLQ